MGPGAPGGRVGWSEFGCGADPTSCDGGGGRVRGEHGGGDGGVSTWGGDAFHVNRQVHRKLKRQTLKLKSNVTLRCDAVKCYI